MKVIENVKDWMLIEKCTGKGNGYGGCGRTLLIEISDLYFNTISSKNHLYELEMTYTTFRCPICGAETEIDNKVPYDVVNYMELNNYPKKIKRR